MDHKLSIGTSLANVGRLGVEINLVGPTDRHYPNLLINMNDLFALW